MPRIFRILFILMPLLATFSLSAQAADDDSIWPKEISTNKGTVVVYQPQPEKLSGDKLEGRAAVAIEIAGKDEPIFGAIWFEARLLTDRDEGTATISEVKITNVRLQEQDDNKTGKLKKLLEDEIPKWEIPISMDQLVASLNVLEARIESTKNIKTEPPKIIFIKEPAVLITIEGEPQLKDVKDSNLQRVINTPYTILYNPEDKQYYLNADVKSWYSATEIMGDWSLAKSVPPEVAKHAPKPDQEQEGADDQEPAEAETPGPPPKILVETEPAELISIDGDPEYKPVEGTDFLYVSNTSSSVLMNIQTQTHYILLSGRWYASNKLTGPWKYVSGDDLPKNFAAIPENSEIGEVLYAVPGTDAAKEAVLDAQIPQTAAIDRSKADLKVEYDGKPKFEKISGTSMTYAVNTATPVIKAEKAYYACDNAVWFTAKKPEGPWAIATEIPRIIYTIPPECPIYNVVYVRIYDVTPEYVYVGYTPGYTGTYVYYTTIVYGTGYYYPGWYGYYYYPRPATWGYHVRWNPYTGWRFGISYHSGPFHFYIGGGGWYRGGWWGPRRYRAHRRGYHRGYRAGYRAGQRQTRNNMYKNKRNKDRVSQHKGAPSNRAKTDMGGKRANNVYADKKGNVHRKTDKGWESKTKDGWKSEQGQQKKTEKGQQKSDVNRNKQSQNQQLNKSHNARQRGAQNTRSRSGARSGGSRGGGGRR